MDSSARSCCICGSNSSEVYLITEERYANWRRLAQQNFRDAQFSVNSFVCQIHYQALQSKLQDQLSSLEKPAIPTFDFDSLMTGYRSTQMIFAAASLGIADLLQDGPKSSGELAILTKSHPESLYRLLRGLASLGIFEEQDDKFALTPSALNLSSHSEVNLAPFALSYGQPWWWIAFGNLTESVQTGIPAFELAHGVSFFSYLNAHPEAAKIFNSNMTAMTKPSAISISKHFDFSTSETVCDIGGGHGILLKTIKEHFPNIKPILFDQPAVVRKADLGPDFTIVPGSFFDSVPPGADLYILKDIIHDWDDARSIQILQNCVTAMKQTSRLLIIERVVPPGNGYSDAKLVDITMLALTGGLERTLKQFEDLFAVVGLKLSKTFELPSSVAILEITLK